MANGMTAKQMAAMLDRLLTCPECGKKVMDQAYGHDCEEE